MTPVFRTLAVAALLLAGSLLNPGCAGAAAEITIVLDKEDGVDTESVNALRVVVRDLEQQAPEVFGPFSLDEASELTLAATIPPEHPFYVDVWGCRTVQSCDPVDVLVRGCSPVETVPAGESSHAVSVTLSDAPAVECPAPAAG